MDGLDAEVKYDLGSGEIKGKSFTSNEQKRS